mgnify:CR=1 FL=1
MWLALFAASPFARLVLARIIAPTSQPDPVRVLADTGVPAENSILYYLALRKAGEPAEMHNYEQGPHGEGLVQYDLKL